MSKCDELLIIVIVDVKIGITSAQQSLISEYLQFDLGVFEADVEH